MRTLGELVRRDRHLEDGVRARREAVSGPLNLGGTGPLACCERRGPPSRPCARARGMRPNVQPKCIRGHRQRAPRRCAKRPGADCICIYIYIYIYVLFYLFIYLYYILYYIYIYTYIYIYRRTVLSGPAKPCLPWNSCMYVYIYIYIYTHIYIYTYRPLPRLPPAERAQDPC